MLRRTGRMRPEVQFQRQYCASAVLLIVGFLYQHIKSVQKLDLKTSPFMQVVCTFSGQGVVCERSD